MYSTVEAAAIHKGIIGIELINAKSRDLAWRMFAVETIVHTDNDKVWQIADSNITKAFKNYPPSPKAIEEKKAQWAKQEATKNVF